MNNKGMFCRLDLGQEERMHLIRTVERTIKTSGPEILKVDHLGSTKNVRMILVEFLPGAATGDEPHAHEVEEVHLVMKGRVYAEQGEDAAEFEEGDTFRSSECLPHLVRIIGKDTAIVLISIYTEDAQSREMI